VHKLYEKTPIKDLVAAADELIEELTEPLFDTEVEELIDLEGTSDTVGIALWLIDIELADEADTLAVLLAFELRVDV
jgi:hypothetical protein